LGLKTGTRSRRRSALVVTPPAGKKPTFATLLVPRPSPTLPPPSRRPKLWPTPRWFTCVTSSPWKDFHQSRLAGSSVAPPRIDGAAQVLVHSSVCALTFGPQTRINPHRNRTDLTSSAFRCAFTGLLLSLPSSWNSSDSPIHRYRHPFADRHRPKAQPPECDR